MPRPGLIGSCLLLSLSLVATTNAQSIGSIRRKAEEAKKVLEAKTASDSAAKAKAAADSSAKSKPSPDTSKAPVATASPTTPPAAPEAKIWENYDFVPGNTVLFYTDFSDDRVGNFARGLKYGAGPIEVVDRDGVKVLRSTSRSTIHIPVGRVLPQRFTLELDILSMNPGINDQLVIEGGKERDRGDKSAEIDWSPRGAFIIGGAQNIGGSSVSLPDAMQKKIIGGVAHIRILMDSGYFKMYTNERRVYNIPELPFKRDSLIRVEVHGSEDEPVFVTSVRLAESETDVLYDALASKGRWMTQGILFATGKAELQPESRAVLKEIAATMKQHSDLKILIEGHTDNVGAPAANLALSDARAAAVKTALVTDYGIAADRLTTKGFGDTKPSVPNTTAAGKAQNRRVELVKQ